MRTLVVSDLLHHAKLWVWSLLVTITGGLFIGTSINAWTSALAWANTHSPELVTLANMIGSNLISYAGLTTAAVVATTLGLTVTAQQRGYALWKVLGIPQQQITRIIAGQLAVVGLVGGTLGALLSIPATPYYLLTWRNFKEFPADMPTSLPWWGLLLTVVVTTGFCVLGGLAAARRAGRTPEMQALREANSPRSKVAIWQMVVAGVLALGALMLPVGPLVDPGLAAELELMPKSVFGGAFALCLAMAALTVLNWTLRPLLFGCPIAARPGLRRGRTPATAAR